MIKISIQFSKPEERETCNSLKKCLDRIPGISASTEYNTAIESSDWLNEQARICENMKKVGL